LTDLPRTASLGRILRGKVPTFIAQRSAQLSQRLPEVLTTLMDDHGGKLGVGTSMKMWGASPKTISEYLGSVEEVPLRLADPMLYRHPNSAWPGMESIDEPKKPPTFEFYNQLPTGVDRNWISNVIQAQYDVGASLALSATGWVGTTNAAAALDATMAIVRESRDIVNEKPMFVNLTMDKEWLIDRELRNLLLRELVESNEKHWYLRFWWPEMKNSYGQLSDADILRGYISLSSTAAVEGKRLFLPNSGLTGWLMGGYGAIGFSTGASASDQAFARQRRMGRQKGRPAPQPTPRIFDRFLLHTMDHSVFERLRVLPAHRNSSTRFLTEIDGGSHDRELAGLHYVNAVGDMQGKMAAADRRVVSQRAINRAVRWLDGLGDVDKPTGASNPGHLATWRELPK